MPKAMAFVRRSADIQGYSLRDEEALLTYWMKSARRFNIALSLGLGVAAYGEPERVGVRGIK